MRVNVSLAVLAELYQCRQVWQFSRADWKEVQADVSLQNRSLISTAPDANPALEFFHKNMLFLMHGFIPSCLQLSHPSSNPWSMIECCGEAVSLKQLTFSSWKANPTEGNLNAFQKECNKRVSTLRRARKLHLSNL